ncbi:MAG: group II intron reverse transcriptase domain-containing protein [Anaerolineales bacterium]|nr:group II intron reverse transcriptase domain-containing protein [Anaerolineales bacterium]
MYPQLTSWTNLLLSFHKAAKGKRGHPNVAAFEYHLEENLLQLQRELLDKSYQPGAYVNFHIHDPKRRLISAAPFRDRVIHHALCNLIEPLFERSFISDSYANRIGKGTHRALDRCQQFTRRYRYVLQCDIRQFFPSIDHEILRVNLRRKVEDTDVLWLIDQILASGQKVHRHEYEMVYFPGDDLLAALRLRGLPIGNLTSQFWANVYLDPFDHFIKRELRCKAYIRFVDDFLLFADDKRCLWEWKAAVEKRLTRLRLKLHPHSHPQPVTNGIPFLGFVQFPTQRRLKRRRGIAFQRRWQSQVRAYQKGLLSFDQLTASAQGWANHAHYGNTIGLRKKILMSKIIR